MKVLKMFVVQKKDIVAIILMSILFLLLVAVSVFFFVADGNVGFMTLPFPILLLIAIVFFVNEAFISIEYDGSAVRRKGLLFGYKYKVNINDIREIKKYRYSAFGKYYVLVDNVRPPLGFRFLKDSPILIPVSNKGEEFIRAFWNNDIEDNMTYANTLTNVVHFVIKQDNIFHKKTKSWIRGQSNSITPQFLIFSTFFFIGFDIVLFFAHYIAGFIILPITLLYVIFTPIFINWHQAKIVLDGDVLIRKGFFFGLKREVKISDIKDIRIVLEYTLGKVFVIDNGVADLIDIKIDKESPICIPFTQEGFDFIRLFWAKDISDEILLTRKVE